jgi:hypothetical protein
LALMVVRAKVMPSSGSWRSISPPSCVAVLPEITESSIGNGPPVSST